MRIVGLTSHVSGNHDNSAALLVDGKIKFAESEERVSRIKHDKHFPVRVIREILKREKLSVSEIDYFASGATPVNFFNFFLTYLKGFGHTTPAKILEWFLARIFLFFAGKEAGAKSSLPASPTDLGVAKERILYIPHYLAHAETAYDYSGMDNCLIVAWDGYGIDERGIPLCGTVFAGRGGKIFKLEDIPVYTSLALYYGAVTVALGFKLNDGEGKTMGLAVYGRHSPAVAAIKDFFPSFKEGKWVAKSNWLEVNGVSRPDYFRLTSSYRHLRNLIEEHDAEQVAYAAQKVLEEGGEKYFRYLVKKYGLKDVAVAGGIFLNVKFNMRLLKKKVVNQIFVYPNPGDGGVAVGAALTAFRRLGGKIAAGKMKSAYLGCDFTGGEIKKALRSFAAKLVWKDYGRQITKVAARHISQGEVLGWFQGRGEWGPRALGARSVLADPRQLSTKERINDKLKQRDWFMPFAPVIMEEYQDKVLTHGFGTPFMTLTDSVKKPYLKKIPAAIHIDGTARAQIINQQVNPAYWQVVKEFYKLTGIPALLNTSFNRHGLPIVHTPSEAIEHLLWGCLDELVLGDYLVTRKEDV